MSEFKVGDKVVCIDAELGPLDRQRAKFFAACIVKGRVYEIENIRFNSVGAKCISLACVYASRDEVEAFLGRKCYRALSPLYYLARRFRKIQKADDKFIARIKACKPNLVTV